VGTWTKGSVEKKRLIEQGRLSKHGKPNEKTPDFWFQHNPDLTLNKLAQTPDDGSVTIAKQFVKEETDITNEENQEEIIEEKVEEEITIKKEKKKKRKREEPEEEGNGGVEEVVKEKKKRKKNVEVVENGDE